MAPDDRTVWIEKTEQDLWDGFTSKAHNCFFAGFAFFPQICKVDFKVLKKFNRIAHLHLVRRFRESEYLISVNKRPVVHGDEWSDLMHVLPVHFL